MGGGEIGSSGPSLACDEPGASFGIYFVERKQGKWGNGSPSNKLVEKGHSKQDPVAQAYSPATQDPVRRIENSRLAG